MKKYHVLDRDGNVIGQIYGNSRGEALCEAKLFDMKDAKSVLEHEDNFKEELKTIQS